jgi:hypothetical protein
VGRGVRGAGCRVQGAGCRVQGAGCRVLVVRCEAADGAVECGAWVGQGSVLGARWRPCS